MALLPGDRLTSLASRTPRLGRHLTLTVCALFVSELVGDAYFGFASLPAHIVSWALSTMLVLAAFVVAAGSVRWPDVAGTSIRAGILAFALVVLCGLALGATHLVARTPYVVAEALVLLWAALATPRQTPSTGGTRSSLPVPVLGLWIAIIAFVIGTGVSHSPFIAYDSLSYHLFFPARWLQAHRLSIIPTPFSDEAQAYQPGNGELWFLWLMLPFHGDVLARIGQLPFYLLGGTTLYALARRLGATPVHAMYAPTFFFITPTVVEQAVGANVDLINAALFVTSLEIDNVWHNAQGFPIEDEWAKADPVAFRLAYENPGVRIYEVHLP